MRPGLGSALGFLTGGTQRSDASGRSFLLAVFAVAALLVATRRPDAFTNPQFYLEDGIWYADAHERGGFAALLTPYRGYFVAVQRLFAWLAQAFPLRDAPVVLAGAAVAFHALPAVLISSARFAPVVPDARIRVLLALFYLGAPNSWSTIANITHAQWHLAALACLVLVAVPARHAATRWFDVAVLVLAGLSGPFAIFLTPIAVLAWWRDRSSWRLALVAIVAATAAVQLVSLSLAGDGSGGARPPLGASVTGFLALWTRQVVLGAFVGQRGLEWLLNSGNLALFGPLLFAAIGLVALVAMAVAALRGPFELRMILLMAALVLGSALAWPPQSPMPGTYWESIAHPGAGNRYFMLPIFALALSFAWMLARRSAASRVAGGVGLVGIALGVVLDWRQPALRDYDFPRYVAKYENAAPGEKVQIPFPVGWGITLTRKP